MLDSISARSARTVDTGWGSAYSFRAYVMRRKYDFGRGGADAWRFIAFARGAPDFPDPVSWSELDAYLRRRNLGAEFSVAARTVWRSWISQRSRSRRGDACGSDGYI